MTESIRVQNIPEYLHYKEILRCTCISKLLNTYRCFNLFGPLLDGLDVFI